MAAASKISIPESLLDANSSLQTSLWKQLAIIHPINTHFSCWISASVCFLLASILAWSSEP